LTGEFKDYDGELVDPDDAKVIIFDSQYKEIKEYAPLREDVGRYYLDYTVPEGTTSIMYFEFKGTIGDMPVVGRSSFKRVWVK
jgi:hypothetical protein